MWKLKIGGISVGNISLTILSQIAKLNPFAKISHYMVVCMGLEHGCKVAKTCEHTRRCGQRVWNSIFAKAAQLIDEHLYSAF